MVLRLAGIYGPGRVPRVRDVRQGRPIHSSPAGYLNLIHVHDAARATLAAWQQLERREAWWTPGMQSRLYLVGDDQPVVRGEFYREVARQCGVPGPRFAEPDGSPLSVRSESNKRVCNRKLRRDLLPQLVYPNYRLGLADVLRENLQSAPNSLP
jgi:nucleoside-diphosphate-sugar epimerase